MTWTTSSSTSKRLGLWSGFLSITLSGKIETLSFKKLSQFRVFASPSTWTKICTKKTGSGHQHLIYIPTQFSVVSRVAKVFLVNETVVLKKGGNQLRYPNALSIEVINVPTYNWCFGQSGTVWIHTQDNPPIMGAFMETMFSYRLASSFQFMITPKITTTDPNLRKIDSNRRQCYFEDEKKLEFFTSYSQLKCLHECFSKFILLECGCVTFELPRNETTRVCGLKDYKCFNSLDYLISDQTLGKRKCDCKPDCNSIEYETKVIETTKSEDENHENARNGTQSSNKNYSDGLSFTLSDDEFTALRRYASYELVSFVSDVGGLLGLFVGVSIASAIEIFYFITVRIAVDLVKFSKIR